MMDVSEIFFSAEICGICGKVDSDENFNELPKPTDFSLDANHIPVLNVLALVVWKFLRHVQLECLKQILRFKPTVPG